MWNVSFLLNLLYPHSILSYKNAFICLKTNIHMHNIEWGGQLCLADVASLGLGAVRNKNRLRGRVVHLARLGCVLLRTNGSSTRVFYVYIARSEIKSDQRV